MNRKKELKEIYKNTKKDMGVYMVRSLENKRAYIEETSDLKGSMNGSRFKLDLGSFTNKELQADYKKYGREKFIIEVIAELEYDQDQEISDYSEDLKALKELCQDELISKGMEIY